jgi:hypothetical protein
MRATIGCLLEVELNYDNCNNLMKKRATYSYFPLTGRHGTMYNAAAWEYPVYEWEAGSIETAF